MAILPECNTCGRKGGYAQKNTDGDCYRCKLGNKTKKKGEENNNNQE